MQSSPAVSWSHTLTKRCPFFVFKVPLLLHGLSPTWIAVLYSSTNAIAPIPRVECGEGVPFREKRRHLGKAIVVLFLHSDPIKQLFKPQKLLKHLNRFRGAKREWKGVKIKHDEVPPLSQNNRLRRGKMRRKKKSQQTGINYDNAHKNLHNLKCFRLPPATRVLRSSLNLCGRGGGWPSFLISRCAFHKTLFRRGQVCVASLCNRSKQAGCKLCGLEPFFDNSWWSVSVFAEVVNVV